MLFRVTCADVCVGSADLVPVGLAHADLVRAEGYSNVEPAARAMALLVTTTQYWPAHDGDFADWLWTEWPGERLALIDQHGRELSVGVIVLDYPMIQSTARVHVVADFRPALARSPATLSAPPWV